MGKEWDKQQNGSVLVLCNRTGNNIAFYLFEIIILWIDWLKIKSFEKAIK